MIEGQESVIEVVGSGWASRPVEICHLLIKIREQGQDARKVMLSLTERHNRVLSLISSVLPESHVQARGVSSVQRTPDFFLFDNDAPPESVMDASIDVVTDMIDLIGELMCGAMRAGATDVTDVCFGLSNAEEMMREALAAATADARARAEVIAEGLGMQLGPVLSVTNESERRAEDTWVRDWQQLGDIQYEDPDCASPTVIPGSLSVSETVRAKFSLARREARPASLAA